LARQLKNPLKTNLELATPEVKKFSSSHKKKTDDSIADDVRKIKESMKKEPKAKKSREVVKTPVTSRTSRSAKKEVKEVKEEEVVKVEEKPKPKPIVNELKKELLADWSDDEEVDITTEKVEGELFHTFYSGINNKRISFNLVVELPPPPKPTTSPEKLGESSRSIRNIPKKQRVSEVYIQPEPVKVEQPKEPTPPPQQPSPDVSKKPSQKVGSKRKHEKVTEPEPKISEETTDDSLLMATADLLNETEVPKVENAQLPSSTFHKSNDIDKRNLPPKERNKRIFRANNNGTSKDEEPTTTITSPIQNELMLPHKKKQSSRLLTAEKTLPVTPEARKKRNVSGMEVETNSNEPTIFIEPVKLQSPLRDTAVEEVSKSKVPSESTSAAPRRGQKRRSSNDSHQVSLEDAEACSEPKKIHKSDSEMPPRSIVACATETICITSKGQLSVARRDSLVTTQANTVMVTSQVIITEATRQPIVSSAPSTETILTPKLQIAPTIKIPKNALKFPAEKLVEMKKQGLVTVGIDKKNKLTEKGKQIFKDIQKTAEAANESNEIAVTTAPELEQTKTPELVEAAIVSQKDVIMAEPENVKTKSIAVVEETKVEEKRAEVKNVEDEKVDEKIIEEKEVEEVQEEKTEPAELNESPAPKEDKDIVDESTNNNDVEKESITTDSSKDLPEETIVQDPLENGKEVEADSTDDANNGGAGLIALQAETFGGPPNCFYLCRQVDDRYEPVDNQILVLNAQNALVPYEEDIVTDDSLAPADVSTENLTGYPQLSPNSNIIINTPNGQKIELNHFTILALQEQADENGIASIELSGEQLELNINGILEAISQQQEANESEAALIPGALLIDGDSALILDTSDIPPVEIHHTATQVSETLSKPIMSTTVAPEISSVSTKATISETVSKNLNIEDSLATIGVTTSQPTRVPKCLELPITVTNPTIAGKL
jgi:hypothetical protein